MFLFKNKIHLITSKIKPLQTDSIINSKRLITVIIVSFFPSKYPALSDICQDEKMA